MKSHKRNIKEPCLLTAAESQEVQSWTNLNNFYNFRFNILDIKNCRSWTKERLRYDSDGESLRQPGKTGTRIKEAPESLRTLGLAEFVFRLQRQMKWFIITTFSSKYTLIQQNTTISSGSYQPEHNPHASGSTTDAIVWEWVFMSVMGFLYTGSR